MTQRRGRLLSGLYSFGRLYASAAGRVQRGAGLRAEAYCRRNGPTDRTPLIPKLGPTHPRWCVRKDGRPYSRVSLGRDVCSCVLRDPVGHPRPGGNPALTRIGGAVALWYSSNDQQTLGTGAPMADGHGPANPEPAHGRFRRRSTTLPCRPLQGGWGRWTTGTSAAVRQAGELTRCQAIVRGGGRRQGHRPCWRKI